ncbi:hypothetical protein ACHAXR_010290 [Thalassiosira sp. AJA248-18]
MTNSSTLLAFTDAQLIQLSRNSINKRRNILEFNKPIVLVVTMNRYELQQEIGDGSFGRVLKATLKETGNVVAIKHIKQKFKTWKACVDLREVQSLRNMNHPNLVPIHEVIRERDESLYFVFEYMPGGSLYDLTKACIEDRKGGKPGSLTKELIGSYVRQILLGLSYIHSNGYVHRDIKPENILVRGRQCKVADFGLAREVSRGRKDITYYVSTRWYRAPEVILHLPSYGKPIDIFATGLILAELHSLRPLFPGLSEIDQITKIQALLGSPTEKKWAEGANKMQRMNFRLSEPTPGPSQEEDAERVELAIKKTLPISISPVVPRLIRTMIQWNPKERPSADGALEHEYFQSSDVPTNLTDEGNDSGSKSKSLNKGCRQQDGGAELCHRIQQGSMRGRQPLSKTTTHKEELQKRCQPENEFCQYLNALSTSHVSEPSMKTGKCKPSGNRIRPMFPGIDQPRQQSAQATNFAINEKKSARKSARKAKRHNRFNHSGVGPSKPRWLLSNQNMGRRAMEVSCSRPTHVAVDESFNIMQHETNKPDLRDDPFTCLK